VNTVLITPERPAAAFLYVLADERLNVIGQACSGPEVLPLVSQVDPDVVVVDLETAGVDGLVCVQEIAARNPRIRIVVVLSSADREVMSEAFRRGACGCVVLGDAADLPAAIWRLLSGATYEESSSD
jgi:DNA-binding NarL/FixJ family response regulator